MIASLTNKHLIPDDGDVVDDDDDDDDKGSLLWPWEDAVVPLGELFPPVEDAVDGWEYQAELIRFGLEEVELSPGEGGG